MPLRRGIVPEEEKLVDLRTEEEQLEAVRQWWNRQGLSLVITVAVVAGSIWGYRLWQDRIETRSTEASALYQDLLKATEKDPGFPLSEEDKSTARYLVDQLKADYPSSAYARMAALAAARLAVEEEDIPLAETELRWVLAKSKTDAIGSLAQIRLARVLSELGQTDAGILLLQDEFRYYPALAAEVLGDLLHVAGRRQEALAAYEDAEAKLPEDARVPWLEMKKINLLPPQTSEGARSAARTIRPEAASDEAAEEGQG